jgi:hypothetical protein
MEHDHPMTQLARNLAAGVAVLCGACAALEPQRELSPAPSPAPLRGTNWRQILTDRVASFGHRNLIAVVDSAYPEYSSPGVETVATGRSEVEVLAAVLDLVKDSGQLRAHVFLDLELDQVPEADANGIGAHRDELKKLLSGVPVESLAHEDLVARLDKVAGTFRVLVLKTDLALPYTSVFVQLECGYWSDAAEKRLREALAPKKP